MSRREPPQSLSGPRLKELLDDMLCIIDHMLYIILVIITSIIIGISILINLVDI